MNIKRCDIILPTCGQIGFIRNCIESLIKTTKYPYRLIAIDNGSSEEASRYLKDMSTSGSLDMVLIKPEENLGWIKSINHGLEFSKDSEYVSFQNDDTVFTEGWLDEVVSIFEKNPDVGILNPEWEKPKGVTDINKYAVELKKKYAGKTIDIDWCRGHCFVVKREVVNKLGGFDPVYIPVYYDDRDYSLKALAAGYKCVKAKGAFVDHVRNVTMKKTMPEKRISDLMERNGRIFYKRWGYPLRIVFVLRDQSNSKDILQKMCTDQNKVIVITHTGDTIPYEHTNIRVLRFNKVLFDLSALIYIISNRSKKQQKKTDFIFTEDKNFYSFVKHFTGIILAEVIFKKDIYSLTGEALKLVKEKKDKCKNSL